MVKTPHWYKEGIRKAGKGKHESKYYPSGAEWVQLTDSQKRRYNRVVHEWSITHLIRKIPYVPNAIRHMPLTLYPVRSAQQVRLAAEEIGREDSRSKLEGTAEEQQIIARLMETLEARGKPYAGFKKDLDGFLKYSKIIAQDRAGYPVTLRLKRGIYRTAHHICLLLEQRRKPRDELINATMAYLDAKYPC